MVICPPLLETLDTVFGNSEFKLILFNNDKPIFEKICKKEYLEIGIEPNYMLESTQTIAKTNIEEYLKSQNIYKPLRSKQMKIPLDGEGIWLNWKSLLKIEKNTWSYLEIRDTNNKIIKLEGPGIDHAVQQIADHDRLFVHVWIEMYCNLIDWCKQNCKGHWYIRSYGLYFKDDADKALFKLLY